MIRLLVAVALAGAFGGLLLSSAPPEGARAQAGGDVYEGSTDDGRLIRLMVSEDASQVRVIALADPDGVACPAGHVDRFIGSVDALIAGNHFELHLFLGEFGLRNEPTKLASDLTITGDFAPDGTVAGTYHAVRTEDPPCDSGPVNWGGELILNEQSVVPLGGATFSGNASQGMLVEFTLSQDRDFIVDFRVGDLSFEPAGCPPISSSLGPFAAATPELAEPLTAGEFDFFGTVVVAETNPSWTVFVSGKLLSETEAEGTIRVTVVDKPECDTGVLDWTASAPPPTPEPTPAPGELPVGGSGPPAEGEGALPLIALGAVALIAGGGAAGRALLRRR